MATVNPILGLNLVSEGPFPKDLPIHASPDNAERDKPKRESKTITRRFQGRRNGITHSLPDSFDIGCRLHEIFLSFVSHIRFHQNPIL